MTQVKICGLRTAEHALAALAAGADMLGFILAPARRQVSAAEVAAIGQAVRNAALALGRSVELIGVFVNEAPEHMLAIADGCGLDSLQLSGDEPASITGALAGRKLFKAVRLGQSPAEQAWVERERADVRLLVDAHVAGSYGGAGVLADWGRAAELARLRPIVLAGGITPANAGDAVRRVRPWAIDVSSGVETDGVKDVAKIRALVAAVRQADEELRRETYDVFRIS